MLEKASVGGLTMQMVQQQARRRRQAGFTAKTQGEAPFCPGIVQRNQSQAQASRKRRGHFARHDADRQVGMDHAPGCVKAGDDDAVHQRFGQIGCSAVQHHLNCAAHRQADVVVGQGVFKAQRRSPGQRV